MDASSNDLTDEGPATGGPDRAPDLGVSSEERGDGRDREALVGPTGPGLLDEIETDMAFEDVLAAARRRIEALDGLDPADIVVPAAEITEVLGRLIEEDER
jgi:hypothetical protein